MPDEFYPRQSAAMSGEYQPVMRVRKPRADLARYVHDIVGYRETGAGLDASLEMASLVVPLILSFGAPFQIALGRRPGAGDRYLSFAAGLHPGFVRINSTGGAECVQIDFTPLGACRFFAMPMREMTSRMIEIDDLSAPDIASLRQRLGGTHDWDARFDLVEDLIARRIADEPPEDPAVGWALRAIIEAERPIRVADLAADIGWSRKHFAERFRDAVGLGPKCVSRMVRFSRALGRSRAEPGLGWARIAADCFYADQAHLVREFREFSGMSPTEIPPPFR